MSGVGSGVPFPRASLATLQGLGLGAVAVGDPAWDTTNLRMVYCLSVASNSSTWGYRVLQDYHFFYNNVGGAERVVPLSDVNDRGSATIPDTRIVAKADGFVHSISVESEVNTMGVTTCRAYADATGDPTTLIGTAPTQDMDTADKGYVFLFPDGTDFVARDRVSVSVDPTGNNANCGGVVTLGYIITAA
jgi:hypothetical protein